MSLLPARQTEQVNIDFITPFTQERGGCLSLGSLSGMTIVQYAYDPTDVIPFGIQLNDVEWMNLGRQYHRTYRGNGVMTDVPCSIVGVGIEGDWITDWLHIVGELMPGMDAYVGPSGTFTNDPSFGTLKIGEFRSVLKADPHIVVMRGLGFSREYMDPCTKEIVWENNPADQVKVITPGYAKIRVKFRYVQP